MRSTYDKPPRWVDQILGLAGQEAFGKHLVNNLLGDEVVDLLVGDIIGVLSADDNACDFHRLAICITHRTLRLGIRPQPFGFTAFANARQLPADAVGKHDGGGHQLRGFITGKTKHQTLVARTLFGRGLTFGRLGIHTLSDVTAL